MLQVKIPSTVRCFGEKCLLMNSFRIINLKWLLWFRLVNDYCAANGWDLDPRHLPRHHHLHCQGRQPQTCTLTPQRPELNKTLIDCILFEW